MDTKTPGPRHETPHTDADEELLARLSALMTLLDPTPADVEEAAIAAFRERWAR